MKTSLTFAMVSAVHGLHEGSCTTAAQADAHVHQKGKLCVVCVRKKRPSTPGPAVCIKNKVPVSCVYIVLLKPALHSTDCQAAQHKSLMLTDHHTALFDNSPYMQNIHVPVCVPENKVIHVPLHKTCIHACATPQDTKPSMHHFTRHAIMHAPLHNTCIQPSQSTHISHANQLCATQ
eukprot:1157727-Pelagomonas_calceolata.AAC.14